MKEKILRFVFFLSFVSYLLIPGQLLFVQQIVNGYYIFFIPIIPASLTFQMCYIFRKKPKIMTACSFIPCAFIILLGIFGAIFGNCFFGNELFYGWEGFKIGIFQGLIFYNISFPLLPICFIFQMIQIARKIFYIIRNKKSTPPLTAE